MRVLTIIPTYNELESLPKTLGRLRAAVPGSDVLVVDDNSPDGTGQLADRFAAEDSQVHVLHRAGKAGLGAAYIAGFKWGLDAGYDVLVEMDADGSHQPEQLPQLLEAVEQGADLAMGSRWVPGGSVVNWPLYRQAISRVGSTYARIMLGKQPDHFPSSILCSTVGGWVPAPRAATWNGSRGLIATTSAALRNSPTSALTQLLPRSRERNTPP